MNFNFNLPLPLVGCSATRLVGTVLGMRGKDKEQVLTKRICGVHDEFVRRRAMDAWATGSECSEVGL